MTSQEGFTALSEEDILAISEELMRKSNNAYAALAGFPDESEDGTDSSLRHEELMAMAKQILAEHREAFEVLTQ